MLNLSNWQWHKNYRFWWFIVAVSVLIWLVPDFFSAGADLAGRLIARGWDVSGRTYERVTDNEPADHGETHVDQIVVGFEVNDAYHGWGQLLASHYQLPEITGSVAATRMVTGEERTTLPEAGLRSQLRLNWIPHRSVPTDVPDSQACRNFVDQTGRRLRSTGCMEWREIRVLIGAQSTHLCVDLHEASEGHNILGTVQDGLHLVRWDDWHLSERDKPVSASCVELDENGHPYNLGRLALFRAGESTPTGWLTIRFAGMPNLPPHDDRWGTGGF